jgi:hypothetical protein
MPRRRYHPAAGQEYDIDEHIARRFVTKGHAVSVGSELEE